VTSRCVAACTENPNQRSETTETIETAVSFRSFQLFRWFDFGGYVLLFCLNQFKTSTSPRAYSGHLTIFRARGVGNLTRKAFPGVGMNLTFIIVNCFGKSALW